MLCCDTLFDSDNTYSVTVMLSGSFSFLRATRGLLNPHKLVMLLLIHPIC